MQSDGNSFCGDVVSDNFNKASRDEDKIVDQVIKANMFRVFIIMNMMLVLYNIIRKCILTKQ